MKKDRCGFLVMAFLILFLFLFSSNPTFAQESADAHGGSGKEEGKKDEKKEANFKALDAVALDTTVKIKSLTIPIIRPQGIIGYLVVSFYLEAIDPQKAKIVADENGTKVRFQIYNELLDYLNYIWDMEKQINLDIIKFRVHRALEKTKMVDNIRDTYIRFLSVRRIKHLKTLQNKSIFEKDGSFISPKTREQIRLDEKVAKGDFKKAPTSDLQVSK